jgi:hypothetical protein
MKIIIRKEKHDTRYYLANTQEQLHAAALLILAERMDPEYQFIAEPAPRNVEDGTLAALTDAQVAALPTPTLRTIAIQARASFARDTRIYQRDRRQWEEAQQAIRERNGVLAIKVLQARKDHQYEGFEIGDIVESVTLSTALLKRLKLSE